MTPRDTTRVLPLLRVVAISLAMTTLASLYAIAPPATGATPSTFRITELFSNQDGSIQFVQLTETAGLDGQDDFAGLTLTVTGVDGTRTFTFPNALLSTSTANRSVIVGVAPGVGLGHVPAIVEVTGCCIYVANPDFVLPERFLPTEGGTIDFGGIDVVTYPALPVDGASAWYRHAPVGPAVLPRNVCPGGPPTCPYVVHPTPTLITAVEYYNAAQDHYFITASAPDIDALDSGRFAGWQRTGESFSAGPHGSTTLGLEYTYYGSPVCRFYVPPAEGDSHFLSASADECSVVQSRYPDFVLETSAAFYVTLPDPSTGQCGVMTGFIDGDIPLRPVFRLWNGRADTNHRYTTRPDLRAAMIDRGWVAEGYGALGVAFCVQ